MKVLTPYLFVQREDENDFPSRNHYDFKSDFRTYKEAQEYADECTHSWINHWDIVYLRTFSKEAPFGDTINISEMSEEEQKQLCAENGILYE